MTEKRDRNGWFLALWRYSVFFLTVCAIITCCMIPFLRVLSRFTGFALTQESIGPAARLTFLNTVMLSLLCTLIDAVRRRIMIDRPVKRISDAAERVMRGDLSVRIEKVKSIDPHDGFNEIINYFNRMIQELSGTETLRADFIANVSHELKTPLAVIQNYGTMLTQPDLPEGRRLEYAGAITDASRRLADMISNILRLNKLENQTIYPDARTYNLGEQLCECLLGFENAWEKKNLDIQTDIEEDVYIDADPELLSLVWNNLFSNAVKFTESGGVISLALKTEEETAVISVSDTGCGIPPETGQHIFEKFYQGDASHSTEGNGLGLALVKRVIDITGGTIEVYSQAGCGSTFTVRLRRRIDEKA